MTTTIIDCYTDEPAGLGVHNYLPLKLSKKNVKQAHEKIYAMAKQIQS